MKNTVTYEQVKEFLDGSARWLTLDNVNTPLGYAVQKMRAKCEKIWGKYLKKADRINVKHASLDDRGNLLRVNGEYQFTPTNDDKRAEETDKVFETETVEIEPHYIAANRLPKELPLYARLPFVGFVLTEDDTLENAVIPPVEPKEVEAAVN